MKYLFEAQISDIVTCLFPSPAGQVGKVQIYIQLQFFLKKFQADAKLSGDC